MSTNETVEEAPSYEELLESVDTILIFLNHMKGELIKAHNEALQSERPLQVS